jgi:hypothetical protein
MNAAEPSGDSGRRLSTMWNLPPWTILIVLCKLVTTEAFVDHNNELCLQDLKICQSRAKDVEQQVHIMTAIAAFFCILSVATLLFLYKNPTTPAAAVGGDDPTAKFETLTQEHVMLKQKYKVLAVTTQLYKSTTSTLEFTMPECMVTKILSYISEDLGKKFYGLKYMIKWLIPINWIVQFLACGIIVFVIMVPIYTCMGIYEGQLLSWTVLQSAITSSFELIMWLPMTVWNWFMSETNMWDSFIHHARATANGWWWSESNK